MWAACDLEDAHAYNFSIHSGLWLIYILKNFLAIPFAIAVKIEKMLDLRIKFYRLWWIWAIWPFFFIATKHENRREFFTLVMF